MNTPVALFAFNRAGALKESLAALSCCIGAEATDLYIFIDGPRTADERKKTDAVAAVAADIGGFNSVTLRHSDVNRGLGPSIIAGVSELVSRYGRVIVLEDDLVVTRDFLCWMNAGLERYEAVPEVFSVCGYTNKVVIPGGYPHDGFFAPRSSSWGWATWKDRWDSVDWEPSREAIRQHARAFNRWGGSDCAKMLLDWKEGRNKSWAIRFCFSEFLQGKVTLFPNRSRVDPTLGFVGDGTNCKRYSRFKWEMATDADRPPYRLPEHFAVVPSVRRSALRYHSVLRRAWSRLMYLIYR